MKVEIQIDDNLDEPHVIIQCRELDGEIENALSRLSGLDQKIIGKHDGGSHILQASDVLYFESVDRRTFAYTHDKVFEVGKRLYEIADDFTGQGFEQVAKNCIVNLFHIESFRPYIGGRLIATLDNKEQVVISRAYAKAVKKRLGL